MNKALKRTLEVVERLSQEFNLRIVHKVEDEDTENEMIYFDSWITARVETRYAPTSTNTYPYIIVEVANYTPATRSQPEDVDIDEVLATLSYSEAGVFIAELVMQQVIEGVVQNMLYSYDAEDEPELEQVWDK